MANEKISNATLKVPQGEALICEQAEQLPPAPTTHTGKIRIGVGMTKNLGDCQFVKLYAEVEEAYDQTDPNGYQVTQERVIRLTGEALNETFAFAMQHLNDN